MFGGFEQRWIGHSDGGWQIADPALLKWVSGTPNRLVRMGYPVEVTGSD
jgi:hypothetical protein